MSLYIVCMWMKQQKAASEATALDSPFKLGIKKGDKEQEREQELYSSSWQWQVIILI